MPATVRTYTTGNTWTPTAFFTMLRDAFRDLGYFTAAPREGGVSNWAGAFGTTLATQASRDYVVNQASTAVTGQSGTRWYIQRNSSGTIATLACLRRGTGFAGHKQGVGVSYTQAGTTVTVTTPLHGLPVGRRIWMAVTAGGLTSQMATVASVVDVNTFTVTVSTSATTSGTFTLYACAGTYSRSGTTVTTTIDNHGLANGERIYVDHFSGAATDTYYTVTVVDANTITYTDTASGTTSGNCWVAPCIRIRGSDIGGVDGADDYWIRVDRSYGAGQAANDWLTWNMSGPYVIWDNVVDASKQLGSTLYSLALNGNNLVIQSGYVFDFAGAAWYSSQAGWIGAPHNSSPLTTTNIHVVTVCNGTTNAVTLKTYQSELDPRFAIFQFTQAGVDYASVTFHTFQPGPSAPYNLDQASHSSYTRFVNTSTYIEIKTAGQSNAPLFSGECKYTITATGSGFSSIFYPLYASPSGVEGNKLYGPTTYPTITNFGPLVNKVPLNPGAIPSFYMMPDDFGYIATVGSAPRAGDTITASPTEVYTVINYASTAANSLALVARTT